MANHTHTFLAPIYAQVATVSITGVLVWGIAGRIAQVCVSEWGGVWEDVESPCD